MLAILGCNLPAPAQTADEFLRDGLAKYKAGQYAEAITCYNKAIRIHPDYTLVLYGRALAKMAVNDSTAEADLSKAIALDPAIPEYYFSRGKVYYRKDDYPRALNDFNKAIELRPNYAEAWCYRGETKEVQKNFQGAIPDAEKAISLKPDYANAWYVKGLSEYALLHYDSAINTITKCLSLKDTIFLGGGHYFRGMAEFRTGQKDAACRDFDEARKAGYKDAETAKTKYCN